MNNGVTDSSRAWGQTIGIDDYPVLGGNTVYLEDGIYYNENVNVTMVNGAQVRYSGGLDANGKVSAGNGLRFLATVDRSEFEAESYGMKITAEGSSKEIVKVEA